MGKMRQEELNTDTKVPDNASQFRRRRNNQNWIWSRRTEKRLHFITLQIPNEMPLDVLRELHLQIQ